VAPRELVAIGGSWGGLDAARTVLRALPADFTTPIVVVLHRSPRADSDMLERMLGNGVERRVCEVDDKAPVAGGCVFVAPADYHLLVDDGHLALSTDAPVNFSRPSIDVLFESAADEYGAGLVAVVLTGANDDGAVGVRHVVERGGRVIVQDPEGAERSEMPKAAIAAAGSAARVAPLTDIARVLVDMFQRSTQ
jgi:two-component system chemotaxis response regulator CheB